MEHDANSQFLEDEAFPIPFDEMHARQRSNLLANAHPRFLEAMKRRENLRQMTLQSKLNGHAAMSTNYGNHLTGHAAAQLSKFNELSTNFKVSAEHLCNLSAGLIDPQKTVDLSRQEYLGTLEKSIGEKKAKDNTPHQSAHRANNELPNQHKSSKSHVGNMGESEQKKENEERKKDGIEEARKEKELRNTDQSNTVTEALPSTIDKSREAVPEIEAPEDICAIEEDTESNFVEDTKIQEVAATMQKKHSIDLKEINNMFESKEAAVDRSESPPQEELQNSVEKLILSQDTTRGVSPDKQLHMPKSQEKSSNLLELILFKIIFGSCRYHLSPS